MRRLLLAVAFLSMGGLGCFKDLLGPPRAPVYKFTVSPSADTIVAGDIVSPFSHTLTRDGTGVPVDLSLRVSSAPTGSAVETLRSGQLVGRACGVVTLVARPVSSALPTSVPETTVTVTVIPARVTLAPTVDTLHSINETANLSATAWDTHATAINCTGLPWSWRSEDTMAARVSSAGVANAIGNGTTRIWVRVGLDSAFALLTVAQRTRSVVLSPAQTLLTAIGARQQLTSSPNDSLGTTIAGRSHHWGSSNPDVVAVDSTGLLTAKSNGWAWATDTVDGVVGRDSVTVSQVIKSCEVAPDSVTLRSIGATQQLTVTCADSLGTLVTGRPNRWATTNTAVVTVSGDGLLTAVGNGWTWVTDTVDGVVGRDSVTVYQVTKSVVLSPPSPTLTALRATLQLASTPQDSLGTAITGRIHHWGISDTTVIASRPAGLTSVGNGWAWVTDTVDGVVGRDSVTVRQVTKSVSLNPAPVTLTDIGATQQLIATPKDSLGNPLAHWTDDWRSSDTSVVKVSSDGLVVAERSGVAWIVDTVDGVGGKDSVTVRLAAKNIAVFPSGASVSGVGATHTFTAVARDTFGAVIPGKSVTWSSLNPNVAIASSSTGVVTAASSGQATVSASADGLTAYALVTVATPGATPVDLWAPIAATNGLLNGIWGAASPDVYAVGDATVHFDGSKWSAVETGATGRLQHVWGSSSSDIYAVGLYGSVLRYDGVSWSSVIGGTTSHLLGAWGASPRDVYAVGGLPLYQYTTGTILHYDGSTWTATSFGVGLLGVWGTSTSDVYAVGVNGTILHYNGTAWNSMASGTSTRLNRVWGTSKSDVFAVGSSGTMLHYNGSAWTALATGTSTDLIGIWGSSGADVYAVGVSGTILHYDGASWSQMTSGTTHHVYDVWGTGPSDVYAVTDNGVVLRGVRGASVAVTPGTPLLTRIGATVQLTATAKDALGNGVSGVAFTWSTSDATVATVDASTGVVTAAGGGTATITAAAPGGASGSATVTVPTWTGERVDEVTGDSIASVWVADADNDGKNEVLASTRRKGLLLTYRLQGGSWTRQTIDSVSKMAQILDVGDEDNDGRNEILVGLLVDPLSAPTAGELRVYKFNGASWGHRTVISGSAGYYTGAIGDADGDGSREIVVGMYRARTSGNQVQLFKDVSGTFQGSVITPTSEYGTYVAIGDGMGIGAQQIYVGTHTSGSIYAYRWSGTAWVQSTVELNTGNIAYPHLADADNDGTQELLVTKYGGAWGLSVYDYQAAVWSRTILKPDSTTYVDTADLYANGSQQLVARSAATLYAFEFAGGNWNRSPLVLNAGFNIGPHGVGVAANDGRQAIVTGQIDGGKIWVFRWH